MNKSVSIIFLMFLWFGFTSQMCTKEIAFSSDFYSQPRRAYFESDRSSVLQATQKTLERLGYSISILDEEQGKIITGWKPVEADSHYAVLFDRKDFGMSDGAYYQLTVDLFQEGSKVRVLVGTTVKSIAGKLESTGKVEKRILVQLEDQLRSPQIEMSNVGVKKK